MNLGVSDHDPAQRAVFVRAEGGQWVPFGEASVSWEGTRSDALNAEGVESI